VPPVPDDLALLLLPRPLESFILRDQAQDLLRAPGVVAADPPPVPYGVVLRMPQAMAHIVAARTAKRLTRALRRQGTPRVVVIFHPVQWPLARALLDAGEATELWYWCWDRFDHAYDASPSRRARLTAYHEAAAHRASLTIAASVRLAELERESGRVAELVPLSADLFPAPEPGGAVVAVSLGHLGRRTDWALLRGVAERMPELVLLLVGAWHDDEARGDEDYAACRVAPNLVWLGEQGDEAAARLIQCADVGIVPFKVEPFNDAGLPYRILKYARLGRRTISPPLAGVATWAEAVTIAPDVDGWVAALRASAGLRTRPDEELRAWALAQTAARQNAPLWERLREAGVVSEGFPGMPSTRSGAPRG
jgi:hypothetical protein